MQLPPVHSPIWTNLVTGKSQPPLKFLAAKIMLGRLIRKTTADPSAQTIQECTEKIYDLYTNNLEFPQVKQDIELHLHSY